MVLDEGGGEGVAAGCFGEGGAAGGGEGGDVGEVAGDVGAEQVELFGCPEAAGGGGEEVVGERGRAAGGEQGVPGGLFGGRVGERGVAAGGALAAGGTGVAGEFGVDGGAEFVEGCGAEGGEPAEDAPAQFGVEAGGAAVSYTQSSSQSWMPSGVVALSMKARTAVSRSPASEPCSGPSVRRSMSRLRAVRVARAVWRWVRGR